MADGDPGSAPTGAPANRSIAGLALPALGVLAAEPLYLLFDLAVVGRLRRWGWIPRRAECGTPCQTCSHRCGYQAITPAGAVQYDECFQCLDCVALHQDTSQCLPLVQQGRRVVPIAVVATATEQGA